METELPRPKPGRECPLYKKDMSEVCQSCAWWAGLKWQNDDGSWDHTWDCAIVRIAKGQIDVVKVNAMTQAETKAMREEVVKRSISPPPWAVKEMMAEVRESAKKQLLEDLEEQLPLALGMSAQRLINGPPPAE